MCVERRIRFPQPLRWDAHEPEEGSVDHCAGRRAHRDLEGGALDVAEPRPAQDIADVLVVPEAERSDRALSRRWEAGRRDEGAQGRTGVPRVVLHPLPAGEDEVTPGP